MEYRDKLLDFISAAEIDEMMGWIGEHPLLDQVDILIELKNVWVEMAKEQGTEDDENFKKEMLAFEGMIESYQEKILDEKMAKLQYELALEEKRKAFDKMDNAVSGVRGYIIECIVTNSDNAKEMRELAEKIMTLEKANGEYREDNWKQIL